MKSICDRELILQICSKELTETELVNAGDRKLLQCYSNPFTQLFQLENLMLCKCEYHNQKGRGHG